MSIVPIWQRDSFGLVATDQVDGVGNELRRFRNAAVGPSQILAPRRAEDCGSGFRFTQADLHGAVAA
jgi:hypothetical protein